VFSADAFSTDTDNDLIFSTIFWSRADCERIILILQEKKELIEILIVCVIQENR
jgi:hypothetical protein